MVNFEYCDYTDKFLTDLVEKNPTKLYIFEDNLADYRVGTPSFRKLSNVIGIITKINRFTGEASYFKDTDLQEFVTLFYDRKDEIVKKAIGNNLTVVLPTEGLGKCLKDRSPLLDTFFKDAIHSMLTKTTILEAAFIAEKVIHFLLVFHPELDVLKNNLIAQQKRETRPREVLDANGLPILINPTSKINLKEYVVNRESISHFILHQPLFKYKFILASRREPDDYSNALTLLNGFLAKHTEGLDYLKEVLKYDLLHHTY